jgi:hypothetical protein
MNYYIEDGKLCEISDKQLKEWAGVDDPKRGKVGEGDPLREALPTIYYGPEGKKLAEKVLEHGDEISALHADGKERMLAAGLSEEEYDLWHYGPRPGFYIEDTKRIEAAMRRIRG